MWNTCLIGRGWKSREGWSRPVLTGDGDTTFQPFLWLVPRLSFCWIVDDIEHCPWSRFDSDRLIASRPLAGSRTATGSNPLCGWNECRNGFGSVPSSRICGGHSPGETPGPIPNPVAKARRGDGTALERVWESSAPPHPNFVWTFRSSPSWVPGRSFFISGFPSRFGVPVERLAPGRPGSFIRLAPLFLRVFRPDPPRVGSREALSVIPGFLPASGFPWGMASNSPFFILQISIWFRVPQNTSVLSKRLHTLICYALLRTQALHRVEQDHVSRQGNGPTGRRPELARTRY